ncbi:RHS repeat-associated core domain-containing protein [Pseudomonas mosselii]|uniref:RHS repeat-associated core domain-containing protein n=1 Tax=Pseudomonas mosselii TaxID=78327 RepID=UPI002B060515|nr:RHS repeat-associated core domain-containing protein [Pseudomonas mosselii]MEA3234072.1 RHS repeat-associated core domain-containing protein [Pseudomonas mosselii]
MEPPKRTELTEEITNNAPNKKIVLLVTDRAHSALRAASCTSILTLAYTPFGYSKSPSSSPPALGFNGVIREPDLYLLGNGHRALNTVSMRFNSPDSFSPFGKGGINAYTYADNDPINRSDPDGRAGGPISSHLKKSNNLHGISPDQIQFSISYGAPLYGLPSARVNEQSIRNAKNYINQFPAAELTSTGPHQNPLSHHTFKLGNLYLTTPKNMLPNFEHHGISAEILNTFDPLVNRLLSLDGGINYMIKNHSIPTENISPLINRAQNYINNLENLGTTLGIANQPSSSRDSVRE